MSGEYDSVSSDFNNDYQLDHISTTDSLGVINPLASIRDYLVFNQLVVSRAATHEIPGKRQFDIVMSVLMLVLMSPVMLTTMTLIWLSTLGREPVFYRQLRVGYRGREFYILKFRSMRVDAEKSGPQMASVNDVRVTRIGRVLRSTRIDELPQLLNVLKGEMSLVGPRPERPEFVSRFQKQINGYALRHQVKPGITGWAQVRYPYGETVDDAANKLYYDLSYIRRNSLWMDILILFQTIPVVLTGHGAR
ncbi:MAG: exopolysaccharide biosynthesis polyprenyl glycosylphosphotransferase [Candidatus Thiodiazotropha sp. (ex. Lucinisca nassula)]|uniref:exopolysaccharide biosynthesis polyprenyl glycosylphosphotransferase n=1 Tax=Candidatus Thiodiazotropha sp. LNASS1 TaxID=3096260 RepID=UPI000D3692BD|nr:exopolysaccharide biosynthesis polyprenyl glycosylphosphotransferase [Candidatus Thiodiazotropha sp. (ex. Lucinisca nassula)]MBW9273692.1 exopolysaccharide biosynthesis polyprenyl glycosylphosphotransferase [Candidatus Thiodiazotropha sp. (ex. Lucinisca nassula)]PUB74150.1 MAG: lipid carrier--UDP-N-acetylgalactosaminyltransferase [gamma proteobacterium symbiont of Ctena orbiculata]PUB83193.1 MAG: lipid carrier--UDP-N-acetylgalactosaminyltransferase [gamma proteobacterium symbiont of Ctena orb